MEIAKTAETHWKPYVVAGFVLLIGSVGLSVGTGLWVYSAVAVGLLFGFFLQKGDLCGASAFSEVIVMNDTAKLWGLWVCIAHLGGGPTTAWSGASRASIFPLRGPRDRLDG